MEETDRFEDPLAVFHFSANLGVVGAVVVFGAWYTSSRVAIQATYGVFRGQRPTAGYPNGFLS